MKKHGTIEKVGVMSIADDDSILRVIYWWKRGDEVLRHTSFFKIEGTSPPGINAAEHLAQILTTVQTEPQKEN